MRILHWVKRHKVGTALLLAGVITLFVFVVGASLTGKKANFVSADFNQAIQQITAEYFFDKPLPPVSKSGNPTKEDYHKMKLGEHYQELGDKLCGEISKSYRQMIGGGIKGKYAYQFDEDLTKTMRDAGAYVLPLRVEEGLIQATYYNPDWRNGEPNSYGNIKGGNGGFVDAYREYYRKLDVDGVALEPKEEGLLDVKTYPEDKEGFRYFYDYAVKQHGFETRAFDTNIDFVHSYLFIFDKNPDDLNAETLFFYIDLPYHVEGKKYGEISKLSLQEGRERHRQVRCHAVSESALYSRGMQSRSLFIKEGRALTPISDIEPLTIPLNKNYGRPKLRLKPGVRGRVVTNSYSVEAEDVAGPSLRCWMLAMGYVQGDYDQCRNTGYAQEYMAMLNRNICVWKDKITKAPERSYPYKVNVGYHVPDYADGGMGLVNRCSPEPYRKSEGGNP